MTPPRFTPPPLPSPSLAPRALLPRPLAPRPLAPRLLALARLPPAARGPTFRVPAEDRWWVRRERRRGMGARMRAMLRGVPLFLTISLFLHLGLAAGGLLLARMNTRATGEPDKQPTVELVMVERQGEAAPATPPGPTAPRPETRIREPATQVEPAEQQPPPEPAAVTEQNPEPAPAAPPLRPPLEALAPPIQPPVQAPAAPFEPPVKTSKNAPEDSTPPPVAPAPAPPAPPAAKPVEKAGAKPEPAAPRISLGGTDSPSDAISTGPHVIPAASDAVFHNRPPVYPGESVRRGERGTVVVVIQVSPEGRAAAVDVVSSSGHVLLDQAAREAVLAWRFLPAMQGGRAVGSELPMRFVFDKD